MFSIKLFLDISKTLHKSRYLISKELKFKETNEQKKKHLSFEAL